MARKRAAPGPAETTTQTIPERPLRWEWYFPHGGFEIPNLPTQGRSLRIRHIYPQIGLGTEEYDRLTQPTTGPTQESPSNPNIETVAGKVSIASGLLPPTIHTTNVLELYPTKLIQPQQTYIIAPFHPSPDTDGYDKTPVINKITELFRELTGIQESDNELTTSAGRTVPQKDINRFFGPLAADQSLGKDTETFAQTIADIITARDPNIGVAPDHKFIIFIPQNTFHLQVGEENLGNIIETRILQKTGGTANVEIKTIESLQGQEVPEDARVLWPVIPSEETRERRLRLQNDQMEQIIGSLLFTEIPVVVTSEAGSGKTELTVRSIALSHVIARMPHAFYTIGRSMSLLLQKDPTNNQGIQTHLENIRKIGFPYDPNPERMKKKVSNILNEWFKITDPNKEIFPIDQTSLNRISDPEKLRLATVLYIVSLVHNHLNKDLNRTIQFIYPHHNEGLQQEKTLYDIHFHPFVASYFRKTGGTPILGQKYLIGQSILKEFLEENQDYIRGTILEFGDLLSPITILEKIAKDDEVSEISFLNIGSLAYILTSFAYLRSNALTLNERLAPIMQALQFQIFEGSTREKAQPQQPTTGQMIYYVGSRTLALKPGAPDPGAASRVARWFFYYTRTTADHWKKRLRVIGANIARPGIFHEGALDIRIPEDVPPQAIVIVPPRPELKPSEIRNRIDFVVKQIEEMQSREQVERIFIVSDINRNPFFLKEIQTALKQQGLEGIIRVMSIKSINSNLSSMFQKFEATAPQEGDEEEQEAKIRIFVLDKTVDLSVFINTPQHIKSENVLYKPPQSEPQEERRASPYPIETLTKRYGISHPDVPLHPFIFWVEPDKDKQEADARAAIPSETKNQLEKELSESINRIILAVIRSTYGALGITALNYTTDSGVGLAISEEELNRMHQEDFINGMMLFTELTHLAYWLTILPQNIIQELAQKQSTIQEPAQERKPLQRIGIDPSENYGEPLSPERRQFVNIVLATLLKSLEIIHYYETIRLIEEEAKFVRVENNIVELLDESFGEEYDGVLNKLENGNLINYALEGLAHILEKIKGLEAGKLGVSKKYLNLYKHLYELFVRDSRAVSLLAGIVSLYTSYWIDLFTGLSKAATSFDPRVLEQQWWQARRNWQAQNYGGLIATDEMFGVGEQIFKSITRNAPTNFFDLIRQAAYQFSPLPAGIFSMYYQALNAPTIFFDVGDILNHPNIKLTVGTNSRLYDTEQDNLEEWFVQNPQMTAAYRIAAREISTKEGRILSYELPQVLTGGFIESLHYLWSATPASQMRPLWQRWDSDPIIQKGLSQSLRDLFLLTIGPAIDGYVPTTIEIGEKTIRLLVSPYPLMGLVPSITSAAMALVNNGLLIRAGKYDPQSGGIEATNTFATANPLYMSGLEETKRKLGSNTANQIMPIVEELATTGVANLHKANSFPTLRVVAIPDLSEDITSVLNTTTEQKDIPKGTTVREGKSGEIQLQLPKGQGANTILERSLRKSIGTILSHLNWRFPLIVVQSILYRIVSITTLPLTFITTAIFDEGQDIQPLTKRIFRVFGRLSIVGDNFQRIMEDFVLAGIEHLSEFKTFLQAGLRNTTHNSTIHSLSTTVTPVVRIELGENEEASLPFDIAANLFDYYQEIDSLIRTNGMRPLGIIPNPYGVSIAIVPQEDLKQIYTEAQIENFPEIVLPQNRQSRSLRLAIRRAIKDEGKSGGSGTTTTTTAPTPPATSTTISGAEITLRQYDAGTPRHEIFHDVKQSLEGILRQALSQEALRPLGREDFRGAVIISEPTGETQTGDHSTLLIEEIIKAIAFSANYLDDYEQLGPMIQQGRTPVLVIGVPKSLEHEILGAFQTLKQQIKDKFQPTKDNRLQKMEESMYLVNQSYLSTMAAYALYQELQKLRNMGRPVTERENIPFIVVTSTNLEEFITATVAGQAIKRLGVAFDTIPPSAFVNTEQFKGHQNEYVFTIPSPVTTANPFRQYVASTRHRWAAFILSLNKRSKKTLVSYSAAEDLLKDLEKVTDPITKYSLSYDPKEIHPAVSTAVQTHWRIQTAFRNLLTGFGIPDSVAEKLLSMRAAVYSMIGLHQPGPDRKAYERLTHSSKPYIDESGQVRLFPSTNPLSYLRVANEGMTFGPTHSILSIRRVKQLEEYESPDRKVAILAANNPMVAKTRGENLYYAYLFAYNGSKPFSELARTHEDYIDRYHEFITFPAIPILSTEQRILNPYVAYLLGIRINPKKRTGKGPKIGGQTTMPIVIEDEQKDPFVINLKELIETALNNLKQKIPPQQINGKQEYEVKEIIIRTLFELFDATSDPWEKVVLSILIDSINFNRNILVNTISALTSTPRVESERTEAETEIIEAVLDVILPRYILVPQKSTDLEADILTETVGNDSETEMDTEVVTDLSESALADRHDFIPPTSRMEGLKRVIESIRTNRGDDSLIETLFDMDAKRNPWIKTVSEIINGPNALRDRTAYASPSINGLLGSPRRFFRTPYIQYTRDGKLKRIPVSFVPIHSLANNPGVRSFLHKLAQHQPKTKDSFFDAIGLAGNAHQVGNAYSAFLRWLQTEIPALPRLEDLTHPWNENEPLDIDQSKELDQLPDLVTVLLGLIVEEFASPDGNVPEDSLTELFDNKGFVRDLANAIVHFIQGWNEINRDIILARVDKDYIHSFVYACQQAANHTTNDTVKTLFEENLIGKFTEFLRVKSLKEQIATKEKVSEWWATMIYYSLLNDATRVLPMIGMIFRAPVIYDSSYMPTAIASWALPYIALPYPLAIKSMGGDIDGDTVRALVMPNQHKKDPQRLSALLEEIEQRWDSIMRGDNLSQPPGNESFNEAPETEITAYTSGTLWQVSGIVKQRTITPKFIITDNPFEWAIEKNQSERLSLLLDSQTRLEPVIDWKTTPYSVLWKPVKYRKPRSTIPQIVFTAPISTTDKETQQTHEQIKSVLGLQRYAPIDPDYLDKNKANRFESPYHYYGTVLQVALRSQKETHIHTTLAHAIFLMQLFGMYPDPSTQQLAVDALYQAAQTVGFFAEDISEIQPISREKVIEFFNAIADENIRKGLLYSYQEMTTNPFNNPILGDVEKIVKKADLPPIGPIADPKVKKRLKQLQTVIGQTTVDAMVTIARLWLLSADYWRRHISEELKLETPIAIKDLVLNPNLARIERIPAQVVFGVYYEQPEGQLPIVPILGRVQIENEEYEVFIDLNEESVIRRVIDTNTQTEIEREVVFSLRRPDRFDPRTEFLVPEISIALTDVISNIPYDLSENEMGALLGRSVSAGQYTIYWDLVQSWIATKFQSWAETIGVHSAMILGEYIYRTMPQLSVSITPHAMLRRQVDLFSNAINLKRLVAAARAESILEPSSIILELKGSDGSIEKRYVLGQLRSSPIVGRLAGMLGQKSVLTISTDQPKVAPILSKTELPISERLNKELKQLVGTGSNSIRTAYAEQVIIKDSDCLASTNKAASEYVPTKLAMLPTIDLLPTDLVSDMLTNEEYSRSIRERILYQAGGLKLFGKPTKIAKKKEEIVIGEIVLLVPADPQKPNKMILQTVPILKPQNIDLNQTHIATLARKNIEWEALVKAIETAINNHIAKLKKEEDGEQKAKDARVVQIILYHRSPLRCLYRQNPDGSHQLRVCKHCTGESAINQGSVEKIIPSSSAQTPIDAAKGFYNGPNTEEAAFLEEVRNLLSGTLSVITSNRGVHPTQHIRTKVIIPPIRVHLSRAIAKPGELIPQIMPPSIIEYLQQKESPLLEKLMEQAKVESSDELIDQITDPSVAKIDPPITLTPNIGIHTTNAVRIYVPSVPQVADQIAWLLNKFSKAKTYSSENDPSKFYRYFASDSTSLLTENPIFIVNTQNDRIFLEKLLQERRISNELWSAKIFSLEEAFQNQETLQHEILLTLVSNNIIPPIPQDIPGIENYILGTLLTDVTLVPETQYQSSDADHKYRLHMRLANLRFHIEPQEASEERIYYTIKMQHYDPAIQEVLQQINKRIKEFTTERKDQLLHQESAVASVFLKTATLHAKRRNSHEQFGRTIGLLKSAIAALILDAWTFTYPLNRTEMTGLHLLFAIILQWAERIGHEPTTPLNKSIDEITQDDLRLGYLGIVLGTITPNTRTPGNMPVLAQATQRPRT
jgi:hypothetical protein